MYTGIPVFALLSRTNYAEFKYRDRTGIVADILDTVKGDSQGKTKTGIMRSANLNFEQLNRYLDVLLLNDYLRAESPLESHEVARYRLTGKGLKLARELDTLHFALKLLNRPIE